MGTATKRAPRYSVEIREENQCGEGFGDSITQNKNAQVQIRVDSVAPMKGKCREKKA